MARLLNTLQIEPSAKYQGLSVDNNIPDGDSKGLNVPYSYQEHRDDGAR